MAQSKPILSSDLGPKYDECRRAALTSLRRAADEWAKGDPESPVTEMVLDELLHIFRNERLIRSP